MKQTSNQLMERYGLRRSNFILDPLDPEDSKFWAPHPPIDLDKLKEDLLIDLDTSLAPKRLIWGPYGGGKTHTLGKVMKSLEGMTQIHTVYVECPDMSKKSTFIELYRDGIMRAMGEDFVLNLFEETVDKCVGRREEILSKLRQILGEEELAKAIIRLIDPNFDRLSLWSWFSGVSTSRAILNDLGQTQDLTTAESAYLASLIIILGKLLRMNRGITLVLILDEMERLRYVGPDTAITFLTAFTRLTDPNQKYVSVLIGVSAPDFRELPDVFSGEENPVTSRLGEDAKIQIPELNAEDVDNFIKALINYLRNPNANLEQLIKSAQDATKEMINKDLFPFTNEAMEAIKAKLQRRITPREIMHVMTRAAGRANHLGKLVVTSDIII